MQKDLDKMNAFMENLIDKLNSHKPYDITELALKAGISLEIAEEIAENLDTKTSNGSRKRKR